MYRSSDYDIVIEIHESTLKPIVFDELFGPGKPLAERELVLSIDEQLVTGEARVLFVDFDTALVEGALRIDLHFEHSSFVGQAFGAPKQLYGLFGSISIQIPVRLIERELAEGETRPTHALVLARTEAEVTIDVDGGPRGDALVAALPSVAGEHVAAMVSALRFPTLLRLWIDPSMRGNLGLQRFRAAKLELREDVLLLGLCIDVAEPGELPSLPRVDAANPGAVHIYLTTLLVTLIDKIAKPLLFDVNELTTLAYDPDAKPLQLSDSILGEDATSAELRGIEFQLSRDNVLRFGMGLHVKFSGGTLKGWVAADFRLDYDGKLAAEFLGIDDNGLELELDGWIEVLAWMLNPFAMLAIGGMDELEDTIVHAVVSGGESMMSSDSLLGDAGNPSNTMPRGLPIRFSVFEARHASGRLSLLSDAVDQSLVSIAPEPQLDLEISPRALGSAVELDHGNETVARGQTEHSYDWTVSALALEYVVSPVFRQVPEPRNPRWLLAGNVFEGQAAQTQIRIAGVTCRYPTFDPSARFGVGRRTEVREIELRVSVDAHGRIHLRNRPEDGDYELDLACEVELPAGFASVDRITDTVRVDVRATRIDNGGLSLARANDLRAEIEHAVQTGRDVAELERVREILQNPEATLEVINGGGIGRIPRDLARTVQGMSLRERADLRRNLRTLSRQTFQDAAVRELSTLDKLPRG